MTDALNLNRRGLLVGGLAGVSLAFAGRSAFAEVEGGRKLFLIIARGAMDGLSVAPPVDDPNYASLRGPLAIQNAKRIGGGFGLHPALAQMGAMADAGQLRIAPAVAIPERQRSHFEAQDVLESGAAGAYASPTGWLNRALQALGPTRARGLAVGAQTPLVLRGVVQAAAWSPGPDRTHSERTLSTLQDLYRNDALLGSALASGLAEDARAQAAIGGATTGQNDVAGLGRNVARLTAGPDGADLVAISVDGWDTHARQGADTGQLANRLDGLDRLVGGLKDGLGAAWDRSIVVIATEFGRTVRVNGTGGTDHGTGSTAILAGGGLRRGGPLTDFPGLGAGALFENRDVAPATDIRALFKGVLAEHLHMDRRVLDTSVFPDSAGIAPLRNIAA